MVGLYISCTRRTFDTTSVLISYRRSLLLIVRHGTFAHTHTHLPNSRSLCPGLWQEERSIAAGVCLPSDLARHAFFSLPELLAGMNNRHDFPPHDRCLCPCHHHVSTRNGDSFGGHQPQTFHIFFCSPFSPAYSSFPVRWRSWWGAGYVVKDNQWCWQKPKDDQAQPSAEAFNMEDTILATKGRATPHHFIIQEAQSLRPTAVQ